MINTKTQNKSFLNLFYTLQDNGFSYEDAGQILTLKNEKLLELDVNDPSNYSKYLDDIREECIHNIWFFFREIARLPTVGQNDEYAFSSPFQINLMSFKIIWAFNNGVSFIACGDDDSGQKETIELLLLFMSYVNISMESIYKKLCFSYQSDCIDIKRLCRLNDINRTLLPKLALLNYNNDNISIDFDAICSLYFKDISRITHFSDHKTNNNKPVLFGFNTEKCSNFFDLYRLFIEFDDIDQIYLSADSSKIICNDVETMVFHIMPEIDLNRIRLNQIDYNQKIIYTIKRDMSQACTSWETFKFKNTYYEKFGIELKENIQKK